MSNASGQRDERLEARLQRPSASEVPRSGGMSLGSRKPSFRQIFALASWGVLPLVLCSQAGLVNNLNDGMAWGIYPLYFASFGLGWRRLERSRVCIPPHGGIATFSRSSKRPLGAQTPDRHGGSGRWNSAHCSSQCVPGMVDGRASSGLGNCNGLSDAARGCGRFGPPRVAPPASAYIAFGATLATRSMHCSQESLPTGWAWRRPSTRWRL